MAAIAVAGVGLVVVCSSSLAAVMMMGGEEETPTPSTTSAGPTAPTIPSGQYVKLVHTVAQDNSAEGNADDKNKILNLAELEVFAPGGTTSIAAGKTVTGTAINANYPGANLVDGNMTNFAHTFGRDANVKDEFLVDLGSVQEIEKIKITNRVDCCKDRAIGIKAVILGADGTTVVKETPAITTEADTYTFTFPGTAWA
jgi:transcription elongation factor